MQHPVGPPEEESPGRPRVGALRRGLRRRRVGRHRLAVAQLERVVAIAVLRNGSGKGVRRGLVL